MCRMIQRLIPRISASHKEFILNHLEDNVMVEAMRGVWRCFQLRCYISFKKLWFPRHETSVGHSTSYYFFLHVWYARGQRRKQNGINIRGRVNGCVSSTLWCMGLRISDVDSCSLDERLSASSLPTNDILAFTVMPKLKSNYSYNLTSNISPYLWPTLGVRTAKTPTSYRLGSYCKVPFVRCVRIM